MANQITGKVIALSKIQEVASKNGGQPLKKRELYMDCTRFDPYTGERSEYENTPLLEFGGDKVLDKLAALNLQKDDVVRVTFDIQGRGYKDQHGKFRVFTAVRPYDIEVVRRAGDTQAFVAHQPTGQSPQPFPPQVDPVTGAPVAAVNEDDLPF